LSQLTASRRVFHLGLVTLGAALVAIFARTWIPAAAVIPVLGAVVIAFAEILLPLPLLARRQVEPGTQLLVGDEPKVTLELMPAPLPGNLIADDALPLGLRPKPGTQESIVAARDGAVARYKAIARRRGQYEFGDPKVRRVGMLGLFERSDTVPVPTEITILPASAKQLGVRVRARPPTRTSELARSLRPGAGEEFFSLREYQPGDDIGQVNWKATARMNRIITNEFLPPEPPRYLIYIDARGAASEEGETDAFERTLELAAVLVEALIDARAHVGMVLLSYESVFLIPSGGQSQLRRLRQLIIQATPGQDAPLLDLVQAGAGHLPARTDAVLLTANPFDPTLPSAVSFLKARHRHCVLLFPGFPEPNGKSFDDTVQRAAGALLNQEQATALAALRPLADAASLWPPNEPIAVTLSRLNMTGRRR
jgi:uncharacterized protein (DUF58 family)